MKVLEVNDNDIYGKIFNGYSIMEKLNNREDFSVKQLVINKISDNPNCIKLYKKNELLDQEYYIHKAEHDTMSVHSLVSASTIMLENNNSFRDSDLVHFHQVHNCRFSLPDFFDILKSKPSVISFHDMWFMTGRCIQTYGCTKWSNGCVKCENLKSLFDMYYDNCAELWKIKRELANTDVDVIVHSQLMYDMAKQNPYTKNLRIHKIPLGIDMSKYNFKISKEEAKKKLNIFPSDTVILLRENKEMKGTNYVVEALKRIKDKSNITILTCDQKGLLKDIEKEFNVIELGILEEKDLLVCYNAADLFVIPSPGETFCMMAVEAMAAGVTTICFDNTAMPDTVGAPDIGVLAKNLDSYDLYKKIQYYIDNPREREEKGEKSKKYVAEKYDYDKYFERVANVYKEAYEKQKYKIKEKKQKRIENIDYDNIDVKKTINKLNKIYTRYFPKNSKPMFLRNPSIEGEDIKYSDRNVINLIKKFNFKIYKDMINNKFVYNLNDEITEKKEETIDCIEKNKCQRTNPKVSIIIPVYNGEKYVEFAIDSALRQTYSNIEIIVVNDGSTDKTDEICKSYGDKIKYIKKENGGVSTALNLGIKNMTGEYFSWLSHDDLYYPEKVEEEIKFLAENQLIGSNKILYSNYSLMDAQGKHLSDVIFESNKLNRHNSFGVIMGGINGLTLLIPKVAFKKVGLFDEKLRCIQDYKLWYDMYRYGYEFIHIPNVLAVTRVHKEQVTNTNPKVKTEGNKFWIDVVKDISEKEMVEMYGSVYGFYYNLYYFFHGGPYNEACKYCKNIVDKMEKENYDKIINTKVSIIMPFSNSDSILIRAVKSLVNQTHKNIEIILINNGCDSENIELINLVRENTKIKYKVFKEKKNIAEIWNYGILSSEGKFISFCRPNTIMDNKKIEIQVTKMILSGNVISQTSYYRSINNKSMLVDTSYLKDFVVDIIINDCPIHISTVMVEREYIINNDFLFMKNTDWAEDICFYLKILKDNRLFAINERLSIVCGSENIEDYESRFNSIIYCMSADRDFDKYYKEKVQILYAYINLIDKPKFNPNSWCEEHINELNRYEYMQTRECKRIRKMRNIYNKILLKKTVPYYLLDTYAIKNSRLNRIYRKLRTILKKRD